MDQLKLEPLEPGSGGLGGGGRGGGVGLLRASWRYRAVICPRAPGRQLAQGVSGSDLLCLISLKENEQNDKIKDSWDGWGWGGGAGAV